MKIPFARYSVAKNKYDESKNLRTESHVNYQKLMKENAPMNEKKRLDSKEILNIYVFYRKC